MTEPTPARKAPTAFISYAWESDAHMKWVKDLATRLREKGINATLDVWTVATNPDIPKFMESAAGHDFFLPICTPEYKAKFDNRSGGVGYEASIMGGVLLYKTDRLKVIPILRQGAWADAAPSVILSKFHIPLDKDPYLETAFEQLLRMLHGETEQAPDIKDRPNFDKPKSSDALKRTTIPAPPRHYIERTNLLYQVQAELKKGRGVALHGGQVQLQAGGGYGKSVLAFAFAHAANASLESYPGGAYVVSCDEGKPLEDVLVELFADIDSKLTKAERAEQVCLLLSEKQSLLVLDNIENQEQWTAYEESGYLERLTCDLLITTRDPNIIGLEAVPVDQLTLEETRSLLVEFLPSASLSANKDAIETIHRETGGLALVVAAVGVTRKYFDKSDDWVTYAKDLAEAPFDLIPDDDKTKYRTKIGSILDNLQSRLEPAQMRILEYAALLPPDGIRAEWIDWLLAKDASNGLDLGVDSMQRTHTPGWHIERLREYDVLRPMDDEGKVWSVHRLHRKRVLELKFTNKKLQNERIVQLQALIGQLFNKAYNANEQSHLSSSLHLYKQSIEIGEALQDILEIQGQWSPQCRSDLANSYMNRGVVYQGMQDFGASVRDYGKAIEIKEGLRIALNAPAWKPHIQNSLAINYLNRGTAYRFMQNFDACVRDYGQAIEIMENLRKALEAQGQWLPQFQNDLASAYMNRGNVYQYMQDFDSSINDYGQAIEIRMFLRRTLEAQGQWLPHFQNHLARTYINRGTTFQIIKNFDASVQDYKEGIEIMEGLRKALETQGQWLPQFQNDLASTYINRGIAYWKLQNFGACVHDYGQAIEIMENLRAALEAKEQWQPLFQIELTKAYMNRGIAFYDVQDFGVSVKDYAKAMQIMGTLRITLETQGLWNKGLRSDYANLLRSRALCYEKMGRDEDAARDLAEADEIDAIE